MVAPVPTLDILIAAYAGNAWDVEKSLPFILDACKKKLSNVRWRIVLSYNGKDTALSHIKDLAQTYEHVRVTSVEKPGKGNAVLNGIYASPADYVMYMDADLATDLNSLPVMIESLAHADLVSGSRYHPESHIRRDWIRFLVSKIYTSLILRAFLGARFTDPQCGFKALNRKSMLPLVEHVNDSWFFFETELTYRAQEHGKSIIEIPVTWEERPNSSVKLIPTITNFLKNLVHLRFGKERTAIGPWIEKLVVVHDATFAKAKK